MNCMITSSCLMSGPFWRSSGQCLRCVLAVSMPCHSVCWHVRRFLLKLLFRCHIPQHQPCPGFSLCTNTWNSICKKMSKTQPNFQLFKWLQWLASGSSTTTIPRPESFNQWVLCSFFFLSVQVLSLSDSQEVVGFWIPTNPFLSCKLIKHDHGMQHFFSNLVLDDLQYTLQWWLNIGLDLFYCWLFMRRDDC